MKSELLIYTSIFSLMVGMPGSLLGMEPNEDAPTLRRAAAEVSSDPSSAEDWRAPFFQKKYFLSGPSLNLETLKKEIITISLNHMKLPDPSRIDRIKSLLNDDSDKEDEALHEFLYRVYSGAIMKTSPFNDPQKATEILERAYVQEETWSFWTKASLAPKGELTRAHYLAANRGHKEAIAYVKAHTPYKEQMAKDFYNQLKKTKQKFQHTMVTEFEKKWQEIGYAQPFLDVLSHTKTPILDRTRFLKIAADLGDLDSQLRISDDDFPLDDKGRTFPYLVKAAKQGHMNSMYNLGMILHNTNSTEAEAWYRKAVNLGNVGAMNNLGGLLEKSNPAEAEKWYHEAAIRENVNGMYNLGVLLYKQNKLKEAETWFHKAAIHGHVNAMYNMGVLSRQQNNLKEAEIWYRKASGLGYVSAMTNLGVLLKEQNKPEEAEAWYRKAANLGNMEAMYNMGVFLQGQNNLKEAKTWFRKAALRGFVPSMVQFGKQYLDRGASADAIFWFEKAAALGDQDAQKLLEVSQKSVQSLALSNDEAPLLTPEAPATMNVPEDLEIDSELNEIFEKIENPELQTTSSVQMSAQKSPLSEVPEGDETSSSSEDELEAPEIKVAPDVAPTLQPQVINNPKSRREKARLLGLELRYIAEEAQKPNRRLAKTPQEIANVILSGESDHITQADLKALFKDPYFAGQVIVEKTKSGFTVLSHHREKKLHLNAGAHRKHGQEKYTGHIHPNTLKGVKEILKIFDVEKK
jgi:TPR repeat protein